MVKTSITNSDNDLPTIDFKHKGGLCCIYKALFERTCKMTGPNFFSETFARDSFEISGSNILCYKTICAYCKTKTILFCPKISGVSQSYVR